MRHFQTHPTDQLLVITRKPIQKSTLGAAPAANSSWSHLRAERLSYVGLPNVYKNVYAIVIIYIYIYIDMYVMFINM